MLAVQLVARIQRSFGKQIPLSLIYQRATIEDMAEILSREVEAAPGSLVILQQQGSLTPFFCVHPIGGNVFCYVELVSRLGTARPFYALQAQGLDGGPRHTRVEEMAAHYVEELRAVQREGPYLLGGWSFGGVIAFEMAQQLQTQGQQLSQLVLFDSFPPRPAAVSRNENGAERVLNFALQLGLSMKSLSASREQIERLNRDERFAYVLNLAKAEDVLPSYIGPDHISRLWEVFEANFSAASIYRARPYAGRITLIRARENGSGRDSAAEWEPLAAGGLEVFTVPGDHFTFLREPHVRDLAETLQASLDR